MSEPLGSDTNARDQPSSLPEIQTPPPDDPGATTPSELQLPSTENTSSQDAPVLSIDTLTPPPEAEASPSEGLVKDDGEEVNLYQHLLEKRASASQRFWAKWLKVSGLLLLSSLISIKKSGGWGSYF